MCVNGVGSSSDRTGRMRQYRFVFGVYCDLNLFALMLHDVIVRCTNGQTCMMRMCECARARLEHHIMTTHVANRKETMMMINVSLGLGLSPPARWWTVASKYTHAHTRTDDNGYTILNYNKHSSRNECGFPRNNSSNILYACYRQTNERERCRTHLMLWWCPTPPICGLRYSSKAEPRCSRLPARSRALRSDGWLPGGSGGTDLPDGECVCVRARYLSARTVRMSYPFPAVDGGPDSRPAQRRGSRTTATVAAVAVVAVAVGGVRRCSVAAAGGLRTGRIAARRRVWAGVAVAAVGGAAAAVAVAYGRRHCRPRSGCGDSVMVPADSRNRSVIAEKRVPGRTYMIRHGKMGVTIQMSAFLGLYCTLGLYCIQWIMSELSTECLSH